MKNTSLLFLIFVLSSGSMTILYGQKKSPKNDFTRQFTFPDGKQTSLGDTILGGWTTSDMTRVESFTFEGTEEYVWRCAKAAAQDFVRSGKRPIKIDEVTRTIVHSNVDVPITSKLIRKSWVDEVIIEVIPADRTRTKVKVSRKVFELERNQNGEPSWAAVGSNGKVEKWILTKIEERLAAKNDSLRWS